MSPTSIALAAIVPLAITVALVFLALRKRRGLKENGVPIDGRVTGVSKILKDERSDFPDFRFAVTYEIHGASYSGQLKLGYWTVKANYPEILSRSSVGEQDSILLPLIADSEDPAQIEVDYSKVQRKRAGVTRF